MSGFEGKRLLVLAGTGPHVQVVRRAKELGIHTIVADYLAPGMASPAKLIADETWEISLLDVDALIRKCREEPVDGVLAAWSDISQEPYFALCSALGLPCYGTGGQFRTMTNKHAFKKLCVECGVSVIPEYTREEALAGRAEFPVFVKPADSRGSKGTSLCENMEQLQRGIAYAEANSLSGEILIERYIGNKNSFQVNYFFVNGEAYVLRTADGYKGLVSEQLDRVALCSVSPSVYTEEYMAKANDAFVAMMKSIGFENGPVMAQGFYDRGVFRFYDPGLRFPGVVFDEVYHRLFGVDFAEVMITYALTGVMPALPLSNQSVYLDGKIGCILYPTLKAGTVSSVSGMEQVKSNPKVWSFDTRYAPGDQVEWTFTTRQRLAEIVFVAESFSDLKATILDLQRTIRVADENGADMMYCPFDVERLTQR